MNIIYIYILYYICIIYIHTYIPVVETARYGGSICKLQTWSNNTMRMLFFLCNPLFLSNFLSISICCLSKSLQPPKFLHKHVDLTVCFFPTFLYCKLAPWIAAIYTSGLDTPIANGTHKSKFVEYHVLSHNCSQSRQQFSWVESIIVGKKTWLALFHSTPIFSYILPISPHETSNQCR